MSKAVLIMDMPENCATCQLLDLFHEGENGVCPANKKGDEFREVPKDGIFERRMEWCPLKLMPDEIKPRVYDDSWDAGYMTGWNNCLKEIGGNNE